MARPFVVLAAILIGFITVPAPADGAATQPTTKPNAALQYWQAHAFLADNKQPWAQLTPGDPGADDAASRLGHVIRLLHDGAATATADWGIEQGTLNASMRHCSAMQELSSAALFWARHAVSQKRYTDAIDVTGDVLMLAHHTAEGAEGVGLLAGYQIEIAVAKQLGTQLSILPKDALARLAKRVEALPAMPGYEQSLQALRQRLMASLTQQPPPTARQRTRREPLAPDDPLIAEYTAATELAVAELVKIEQLPPAQWYEAQVALNERLEARTGKRFSAVLDPGRMRRDIARGRVYALLLQASIAVAQEGPDAARRFQDPWGQNIHVDIKEDGAIELSSGQPLGKLVFVRIEPASAAGGIVLWDDDDR